jgi:hypothetical protein
MINWEITNADATIVLDIVQRACELRLITPSEKRTTSMDITACHCNGCELDLAGLLAADLQNFAHDVRGIIQHIDRKTGELMDFFTPRYAAKYSITYEPKTDLLSCSCGNTTHTDGFVAVDENGIECEPHPGWGGRYMCQSCGATITMPEKGVSQ